MTWVQKEGVTYCGESLIPYISVEASTDEIPLSFVQLIEHRQLTMQLTRLRARAA